MYAKLLLQDGPVMTVQVEVTVLMKLDQPKFIGSTFHQPSFRICATWKYAAKSSIMLHSTRKAIFSQAPHVLFSGRLCYNHWPRSFFKNLNLIEIGARTFRQMGCLRNPMILTISVITMQKRHALPKRRSSETMVVKFGKRLDVAALDAAARDRGAVIVAGSLYLVGAVRERLLRQGRLPDDGSLDRLATTGSDESQG
jgi:hypothetical protein